MDSGTSLDREVPLMRYAAGRKEQTRARILGAAARLFRRQGYQATGIDRVMEEAGLTAGGFYAHFDSKQALWTDALTQAGLEVSARRDERLAGLDGQDWVHAFLDRYLHRSHLKSLEDGCPLVALVSEVSRAEESVKQSFEALVRSVFDQMIEHFTGFEPETIRERTLAVLSLCVGGLGLARAVRDPLLADQILESCRNQARRLLDEPGRDGPRRPSVISRKGGVS